VTSAGFTATDAFAAEIGLADGEPAWERFLRRFPSVGEQCAEAEVIRPFTYAPRLSYRCSTAAGDGWVLLPSAAAFIDPLFSTGFPLTLLGIERLARILEKAWGRDTLTTHLRDYSAVTLAEADWTASFITACYAAFANFPLFAAFSMFYFAAASYSEMARRLEKPHLVRRFLAADRAGFASGLRRCAERLHRRAPALSAEDILDFERAVTTSVAELNVAGLCEPAKHNWYGVDLEDVIRAAAKLELTPAEMRCIVATAPWAAMSCPAGERDFPAAGRLAEGPPDGSFTAR
jgi:FADH2 O2-dependent halogenase